MKRLAIVTTHPIQYNSPWFNLLSNSENIAIKVFFTWSQKQYGNIIDPGFGIHVNWDIPLLDGFDYCFVENKSKRPGTHHFGGIKNPTLIRELNLWEPDGILIIGWSFNSHLKSILYFHNKIPIFFRGDSTLLDEKLGIKRILRRIFLKWVYRKIDFALYVGRQNKLYYLKHAVKDSQLHFVPHVVDNKRFEDTSYRLQMEADGQRKRLNIPEKSVVFLFAGKLEYKKNPEILIKAFLKIDKELGCHLIFIGNGILEKKLKSNYCSENIHFLDFQNQSEMPITYRMGDIFVLPSSGPGETWGLAVNEAMASMRPVIVSNKCGCAFDLVSEGENGYIFKNDEEEDLLKKMRLMMDRGILKEMGEKSGKIISEWSIEIACRQIEKIVLTNC